MNTRESFIAKILEMISKAMVEDWDLQKIVKYIERIAETYHIIKP